MNHRKTWKRLEEFPPYKVRLLARKKATGKNASVALTEEEIAIEGNIPLKRVHWIQVQKSWDGVTIGDARKFCRGCGFDPLSWQDRNIYYSYIKNKKGAKYLYLKKSPAWETTLRPLIKRIKDR